MKYLRIFLSITYFIIFIISPFLWAVDKIKKMHPWGHCDWYWFYISRSSLFYFLIAFITISLFFLIYQLLAKNINLYFSILSLAIGINLLLIILFALFNKGFSAGFFPLTIIPIGLIILSFFVTKKYK